MLISEGIGEKIKTLLLKNKELGIQAIDEFKLQTTFDYKFLLSYAAGVGAIFRPLWDFLTGQGFTSLNESEVFLLLVSSVAIVYQKTSEVEKLKKLAKDKNLESELNQSISFLENLKGKLSSLIYALPGIVDTGTNILAYTFLLPVMSYLVPGLYTFDVTELIPSIVAGILLNKITNFSGKYISTLLKRIIDNPDYTSSVEK
jgi:hypothetical protein